MQVLSPLKQKTILDEIYLEKSKIYIKSAVIENQPSITVTCIVHDFYTKKPIPYVTTENYVRCLSQASYLLAEYAIDEHLINVDVRAEDFRKAAENYELYYRNLAMTFHQRVDRGQDFILKLSITNAREIKRFGEDFILFTFANEKTVISGEMSFVLVLPK